jgi:cell wall assembly regulator SMI1
MLTEALNRILSWIEQHKPSYVTHLQPGLSSAEIEEIVKRLPFQLSPEVYELYRWRNGATQGDLVTETAWIFEGWTFFPLQEAVKQYYFWRNHFSLNGFHIFYNRQACHTGYVLIDPELENSSVIFESFQGGNLMLHQIYTSLTSMMLTMAECYETGAYSLERNPYGHFYIDWTWKQVYPIWRKYNSDAIASVIQILEKSSPNSELLRFFADILIEFQEPRSVKLLLETLQIPLDQKGNFDEDTKVTYLKNIYTQIEATTILGQLGDTSAVPALIAILERDRPDNDDFYCDYQTARFYAAKALGQLKDRQAINSLTKVLNNPNDEIREIAAWALDEIQKSGAI